MVYNHSVLGDISINGWKSETNHTKTGLKLRSSSAPSPEDATSRISWLLFLEFSKMGSFGVAFDKNPILMSQSNSILHKVFDEAIKKSNLVRIDDDEEIKSLVISMSSDLDELGTIMRNFAIGDSKEPVSDDSVEPDNQTNPESDSSDVTDESAVVI